MLVFKCVSPACRCSGDTAEKTKGEVSQEDWLIEGSAAWRWWVPIWDRHRWDRREWESTGQAGATWLEETDEVWVLETAASSSPNGFFPQHTVVIMQFLNWRSQKQITIRVMTPSQVVKLILHRKTTYSSIWFLVSQIRKTIAYKKTPANCLSVNNLNLSVTTNLIIEVSKEKKVQFVQQHRRQYISAFIWQKCLNQRNL